MRGLPADEVKYTLDKKKRQRVRDIARREAILEEIVTKYRLPRRRKHCRMLDVLRAIIDLALHSGLCCAKRVTIGGMIGCSVRTITRHTKTLQRLDIIAKISRLVAGRHSASNFEYRTNIWAIQLHTEKCRTKARGYFFRWFTRPGDADLPSFARRVLSWLSPRGPPTTSTLPVPIPTDVDAAASYQLAFFDVVGGHAMNHG